MWHNLGRDEIHEIVRAVRDTLRWAEGEFQHDDEATPWCNQVDRIHVSFPSARQVVVEVEGHNYDYDEGFCWQGVFEPNQLGSMSVKEAS
jgi:hypothetical protein